MSRLIEAGGYSSTAMAETAGYHRNIVGRWRLRGVMPNIATFDNILNVMGYKLAIVRDEK